MKKIRLFVLMAVLALVSVPCFAEGLGYINYEKVLNSLKQTTTIVDLLVPIKIELSTPEFLVVKENFDLTPAGIIKRLDLTTPRYSKLASHGHFGRLDLDLPWERLDYVDTLKKYLNK